MVDPCLNTNLTISCICFCKTIIDISTKCLQRNISFTVELCTSHIGTAQTSGAGSFDSLCASFHSSSHAGFHCTTERNTILKLLCDIFCNQLCIVIRSFYFFDVNKHFLRRIFSKFTFQLLDFSAAFTDNNTWFCCVYQNFYAIVCSLDLNFGNTGMIQFFL